MRNVKVEYTVTLSEVPKEIDKLSKKLTSAVAKMKTLAETLSFEENLRASTETLSVIRLLMQDSDALLDNCETLAHGLVQVQDNLYKATQPETENKEKEQLNG